MWVDISCFSRDDTTRVPNVWENSSGGLRIVLVRDHMDNPGGWVFHCAKLGISTFGIGRTHIMSLEQAQMEAVKVVKFVVKNLARDLKGLDF